MATENNSNSGGSITPEQPVVNTNTDNLYPTRNTDNKRLDITELFTHFTANIIREEVTFTR